MIKLKVGSKGEIVIPKKIRESLGFRVNHDIILNVYDDKVELFAEDGKNILQKWKERASKIGTDVKKNYIYGDRLYEDVFK